MYDNLKEKTSKTPDTSVDDTHMAAQPGHDAVWVTPNALVKNAGVEACTGSDNAQIEAHSPVPGPRSAEQRAGKQLKKAEF